MPSPDNADAMKSVAKRGAHRALLALGFGLFACGSRSPLNLPTGSGAAGAAGSGGGAAGSGGGAPLDDPCPSATAGPAAMWRNCSTRDGRARVPAPASPQLKWTKQLGTFGSGQLGLGAIATGPANDVYVVRGHKASSQGAVQRFGANDGAVAWALDIDTTDATRWPVILSTGVIDVFARDQKETLLQIDTESGASSSTTFGFDFYTVPPNPAVGADGSLYLVHKQNVGTVNSAKFISRVRPSGVVGWTTPKLDSLIVAGKLQEPSTLALGMGGAVVTAIGSLGPSGVGSVVVALDPANGALLWQTELSGQRLGGPAVRPDGSIAVIAGPLSAAKLVLLDAQSGTPTIHELSFGAFVIYAITKAGTVIVGTNEGQGVTGLAAVDGDGNTQWTRAVEVRQATLASDGTIFVAGPTLAGLDEVSGAIRWKLSPPNAGSCVLDGALTSGGEIVAVQCDGTLFAAGD